MADERTLHDRYMIRRKVLKLAGGAFHIYGPDDQLAFYANMKAFRLKEDIRLYTDEGMQHEVLSIQARQVIDFSAAYDVTDPTSGAKVGALRRRGFKSMIQDEWLILDADDGEIGVIREDSTALALVRRFLIKILPQSFHGTINGQTVFQFHQHFNPFVLKIDLDFSMDTGRLLDRRLGIAAAILLCAIEGRQD